MFRGFNNKKALQFFIQFFKTIDFVVELLHFRTKYRRVENYLHSSCQCGLHTNTVLFFYQSIV